MIEKIVVGLIAIALLFSNFHLTTDRQDNHYGAHCHYDQVGNWIGALTVTIDCGHGAP